METSITPPMAAKSRSSSASSFDDSYFFKTYVPLSSLPTPPLSSHSDTSTRQQSPDVLFSPGEILDPDLLGPAIHLTNLIPSSTSLTSASVPLVHAILTRANLPLETIALAVCILDSLNSRFALSWRKGCPLDASQLLPAFPEFGGKIEEQHIDSIHPELIILSALILAEKFLDDAQQTTSEYAEDWGHGLWSCGQINFTQRCLLENLGYRLLPLWEESIILEALEDMERAGRQSSPLILNEDEDWETDTCFGSCEALNGMSDGKAVLGVGEQLTPAETPLLENVRGTKDVSVQTKEAFLGGLSSLSKQKYFQLPDRSREPFPVYVDPMVSEGRSLVSETGW